DAFIDAHPILTYIGDKIYNFLQWMDRSHRFAKLAKHGSKTFLRCVSKVEEGATDLARKRGCYAAICGHTHAACAHVEQPTPYFTSGCWPELPCSYLTVVDGAVQLHDFTPAPEAEAASVAGS